MKCETRSGLLEFGQSCGTFRRKSKRHISWDPVGETDSSYHLGAAKTWLDGNMYSHAQ